MRRQSLPFHAVAIVLILAPAAGRAQWPNNGTALCTAANSQATPTIVSDGAGGAIVTWQDYRSGGFSDIYAQRVDASGAVLWLADGVALCTATNSQNYPTIVADGVGGAIVTWHDYRGAGIADIYAQRVNASGAVLWTVNGVALCTAATNQLYPTIASDGAEGAIVTWYDFRTATYDIYTQRINASGAVQWTANGVPLCTAAGDQLDPAVISDGAGGAIVTWWDNRTATYDIYTQRINASGVVQWTANGVALCTATDDQADPTIVSDGAGGAIVTWHDNRTGTNYDIYAQRVNASGVVQWTANGVVLCTATNSQYSPTISSDGAGGAIVTWYDIRSGTNHDVYAQRINASGAVLWTADGVALCTAAGNQYSATIASDGAGGAIVTWYDLRGGSNYDVYAQRIGASGAVQWTTNGVGLCTAANDQMNPTIVSNGTGGAIVTWYDYRAATSSNIYAQRVEGVYGYWGRPEPIISGVADVPNDQGGKVAVNWAASGRDLPVPRTISHYSIWRAVDALATSGGSGAPIGLADIRDVGLHTSGSVFATLPTTDYYWELIGTQSAHGWAGYSLSASTRADSVASDPGTEFFMVAAHDQYDDYVAFTSNVMSGHSVDNLAPAAPLMLTAQRVASDVVLHWNRVLVPDLRDYAVYRATSSGVTPVPINFLASAEDTLLTDAGAPTGALYYIVTAYDVHQNQSAPSNEASVSASTGAGNLPPITALTVLANHPNPFAGTTELRIGLPGNGNVEIEVYDVAGRMVRGLKLPALAAGWRQIRFDGRDEREIPLPSGVYFYRVKAGGAVVTNKMVIAR